MTAPIYVPFADLEQHLVYVTGLRPFVDAESLTTILVDGEYVTTWLSDSRIAKLCGVSTRTVIRWRATGQVMLLFADEVAITLDEHPALIWGPDWWTWQAQQVERDQTATGRRNARRRQERLEGADR